MTKKNLCYCINKGYEVHAAVSILSFCEFNHHKDWDIFICSNKSSPCDFERLAIELKIFGVTFTPILIDLSTYKGLKTSHHFKLENYMRWALPRVIGRKSIIYVDSDTLFCGNLDQIFHYETRHTISAVREVNYSFSADLGLSLGAEYLNSGFLLIDCEAFIRDKIEERAVDFAQKYPERILWPDQCTLNYILDGNWDELPNQFNVQTAALESDRFLVKEAVLVHFTGASKPWHLFNNHPCKKMYWTYRNEMGFSKYYDDLSVWTIVKHFVPEKIKKIFR